MENKLDVAASEEDKHEVDADENSYIECHFEHMLQRQADFTYEEKSLNIEYQVGQFAVLVAEDID